MQKTITVGLLAASVTSQDPSTVTRVYPRIDISRLNYGRYRGYGGYGGYGSLRNSLYSQYYGGSIQTTNSIVSSAISNARSEAQTSVGFQSSKNIFSKVPSMSQVDPLIKQANRVGLMRVIQQVATDGSLKCDQKLAYLSEIFGRIRVALENKRFTSNSSQIMINAANSAITRYESDLARMQADLDSLNITQERANLTGLIADLKLAYRAYNQNKQMIFPVESNISTLNRRINTLKADVETLREDREHDRLRKSEVELQISKLRDRIDAANRHKSDIEYQISSSTALINNNNERIATNRQEMAEVETEIDRLNAEADRLQRMINDLNVEVKDMNNKASVSEVKRDNYQDQINQLELKKSREQQKMAGPEIQSLQNMILALDQLENTVDYDISMHFYNCNIRDVELENVDGIVVFVVRGSRFREYLMNGYGSSIFNAGVDISSGVDHTFRDVNIFGGEWSNTYGYPFPDSLGGDSNIFQIPGSFNCLQLTSASQGIGTISNINANSIGVTTGQGSNVQLNLGSCTGLESTTTVPQVGQVIAFSGVPTGNGINLYKASCWQQ